MRLTVLGCGPAAPQPDTPASGLLVESDATAILLDCGQGVAARLIRRMDPARLSAIIIGHMHADHFIDLSALRYRFAWAGRSDVRVPILLPPGGLTRLSDMAGVISERDGFFDDAFELREYDPTVPESFTDLTVAFVPGRHYVPAWGVSLSGPDGSRIVYAGDTGPNPGLVSLARGAELLVCEATLDSIDDDDQDNRGHLTLDEALEHGREAGVERMLITHYPSAHRAAMTARLDDLGGWAAVARPDLVLNVPRPPVSGSGGSAARAERATTDRGSVRARR